MRARSAYLPACGRLAALDTLLACTQGRRAPSPCHSVWKAQPNTASACQPAVGAHATPREQSAPNPIRVSWTAQLVIPPSSMTPDAWAAEQGRGPVYSSTVRSPGVLGPATLICSSRNGKRRSEALRPRVRATTGDLTCVRPVCCEHAVTICSGNLRQPVASAGPRGQVGHAARVSGSRSILPDESAHPTGRAVSGT